MSVEVSDSMPIVLTCEVLLHVIVATDAAADGARGFVLAVHYVLRLKRRVFRNVLLNSRDHQTLFSIGGILLDILIGEVFLNLVKL